MTQEQIMTTGVQKIHKSESKNLILEDYSAPTNIKWMDMQKTPYKASDLTQPLPVQNTDTEGLRPLSESQGFSDFSPIYKAQDGEQQRLMHEFGKELNDKARDGAHSPDAESTQIFSGVASPVPKESQPQMVSLMLIKKYYRKLSLTENLSRLCKIPPHVGSP
jgi:hypothetical protein